MTNKNKIEQVIFPGLCPPEGCPPPTRIECIAVDKVYDSCFQIDDVTRTITIPRGSASGEFSGTFAVGDIITCALNGIVTCTEIKRTSVGDGFFSVTVLVSVPIRLTNSNVPAQYVDRIVTFTKTVTLCCPPGVEPDCSESTLIACSCLITALVNESAIEVTCDVQVCLVLKCILRVQLLVPSYGFCVPAPCVTLPGVCPPTPPAQCF